MSFSASGAFGALHHDATPKTNTRKRDNKIYINSNEQSSSSGGGEAANDGVKKPNGKGHKGSPSPEIVTFGQVSSVKADQIARPSPSSLPESLPTPNVRQRERDPSPRYIYCYFYYHFHLLLSTVYLLPF